MLIASIQELTTCRQMIFLVFNVSTNLYKFP